ncbi:MAG: intracellular growth attenuator family protein [Enterobacteriaceae bacterium]|jgi:hypothetical protein|nr:intracellular growth attenuator family protein [Enterobacteriaceae bacterium]
MLTHGDTRILTILLLTIFIALVCAGFIVWTIRQRGKHQAAVNHSLPFARASVHKLSGEESSAIEEYLLLLEQQQRDAGLSTAQIKSALTPVSDNVYAFETAIITPHSSDEESDSTRYFIDDIEIYLEPAWDDFLDDTNQVSVVKTQTTPLVVELNGHSLGELVQVEHQLEPVDGQSAKNAAKEHEEHVTLIRLRKETAAEYNLRPKKKLYESLVISAAYIILFFSLLSGTETLVWLVVLALLLLIISGWRMFCHDPVQTQYNIHCVRGVPKRWGLFGEQDNGQLTNIAVGIIDLIYPPHWKPYVGYDLGHKTNLDIYLNRYVVKQGKYLSLNNESINFPLHHWGKNLVLVLSSCLVIALLLSFIPLKLPIALTKAWLLGPAEISVTSPEQLKQTHLKIGDHLTVQGTGMCSILRVYHSDISYPLMPFDCTKVYWGATDLPTLSSSQLIDNALALLNSVSYQLNPQNSKVIKDNPHLIRNAERAGMTLLSDFSDIVLKTEALCKNSEDCQQIKNSLLLLSNEKSWHELVSKSQHHAKENTDIFLRPVDAEALRSQINSIVSYFFYSETHQQAQTLYTKPKGGFYIRNDNREEQMISDQKIKELTEPTSVIDTHDNMAIKQWIDLQRLSNSLLNTEFHASGIIIDVAPTTNGTIKITLHGEPNLISFWRYLGASLLFVMMSISLLYNLIFLGIRVQKNAHRIAKIQNYYDHCFAKVT